MSLVGHNLEKKPPPHHVQKVEGSDDSDELQKLYAHLTQSSGKSSHSVQSWHWPQTIINRHA